jgi:hypothetical protein
MTDRPFCSEVSAESGESLGATASRIDNWILVEYRGVWSPDPLAGSAFSDAVKAHLRAQLAARPRSRLLFIRRPERRREPGLVCFFGSTPERGAQFFRVDLESPEDLLQVDFSGGTRVQDPLCMVCTHGKRDRCCARYGRPLYDALRDQVAEESLWQATHVGGDRFAGNLVVFPHGLYFGRVGRAEAWPLVDELLAGRIYLNCYRGRCCYSFPVQAAEEMVRRETGLTGIDDVALASVAGVHDDAWRVELVAGGESYELDVVAELGELTYLTCNAEALHRPRRFRARLRR